MSQDDEESLAGRFLGRFGFLRDPAFPGLLLTGVLIVMGFLVILLTWVGASRIAYVPLQMPHIVSGGLGGLALIGLGAGLLYVQWGRRDDAVRRRLTDELLDEAAALIAIEPELRKLFAPKRAPARRRR